MRQKKIYTAVMVPVVSYMWAVVSAILIFVVLSAWLGKDLRIATKTNPAVWLLALKLRTEI